MRNLLLASTLALATVGGGLTLSLAAAQARPGVLTCYIYDQHENYYEFGPNTPNTVVERAYGSDGHIRRIEARGYRPVWDIVGEVDDVLSLRSEEDSRFSIIVQAADDSAELYMEGRGVTAHGHCRGPWPVRPSGDVGM
jgi:hypothetical protein